MPQRELPFQWTHIQLGDIVSYGKTQKCTLSDVSDDTWVLELEDVEKESSKILARKTAAERPFKSTKNVFEKGSVLYGKLRPYLNKVVLADASGVCTTEIIPLDAEPLVLNRYLFYWLKTRDFLSYVTEVSYGVNMPRLGTKDGVVAPMVLAPLAEQKVIADKLDTLLAQVDNTKARLERIPEILKRFRQSVLAAAVSGRLTEEWRKQRNFSDVYLTELPENKKTRRGLPEKVVKSDIVAGFNTPACWGVLSVASLLRKGAIVDLKDGNHGANHPKSSEFTASGLPFITAAQMSDSGEINFDGAPKLSELPLKKIKVGLSESGDVIYSNKGTVGRVGIADRKCVLSPQTTYIRVNNKYIYNKYYALLLKSYFFTAQVDAIKAQTTRDFVPITSHYSLYAAIPHLEEQTEIVHRVDELFAYADTVERQVNSALERVNQLTQSILAKAFRGELTAQWREDNPELISGENSAEALLACIKEERAAQAPKKRTRKKTTT